MSGRYVCGAVSASHTTLPRSIPPPIYTHQQQSDIFSLGATMYEISLGLNPQQPKTLPENGQEWQDIRHGILLPMPSTAFDMQMIIRQMMSPEWRRKVRVSLFCRMNSSVQYEVLIS